ncbi:MAG: archaellin/type IV pilin N-terminal domain-containing protein, partial [Nitrososphaerales archaeon]
MNRNNLMKERKGISPIIATLLLILIAIAAGVIVYAYVVGFIGNSTSNSGGTTNTLSIDQVTLSSSTSAVPVTAYVRNEGPSTESFNTGFFVKGSSLNDQLGPAVQITVTGTTACNTATVTVTQVALSVSGSNLQLQLTYSITTGTTGTESYTAKAFGLSFSGGTITCTTTGTGLTSAITQPLSGLSTGFSLSSTYASS